MSSCTDVANCCSKYAVSAHRYVDIRGDVRISVVHNDGSVVDIVDTKTTATKITDINGKRRFVLSNKHVRLFASSAGCVSLK